MFRTLRRQRRSGAITLAAVVAAGAFATAISAATASDHHLGGPKHRGAHDSD
jgi:hypothetical protein